MTAQQFINKWGWVGHKRQLYWWKLESHVFFARSSEVIVEMASDFISIPKEYEDCSTVLAKQILLR